MSDIDKWSETAGNNTLAVPNGAPEGWSGEDVNDTLREVMASVRRFYGAADWVELTDDLTPRGAKTITRISDIQFNIIGCDATGVFTTGRLVQYTGATVATCQVVTSIFAAGNTAVIIRFEDSSDALPATPTKVEVLSFASAGTAILHDVGPGNGLDADTLDGFDSEPLISQESRIINSGMEIDQRNQGASVAISTAGFSVDRWIVRDNGSTMTAQRTALALGFALEPSLRFYQSLNVTTAGGAPVMEQYIPDVRSYSGQTVMVSFYADIDTSDDVVVDLEQYFGSGGSASGSVTTNVDTFTIAPASGAFARYSAEVTIPSVSGKTIDMGSGITNEDALIFRFTLPNAVRTVDITGVQIDPGTKIQPYRPSSSVDEYRRCREFYYYNGGPSAKPGDAGIRASAMALGSSSFFIYAEPLAVPMRTVPTGTAYAGHDGSTGYWTFGGGGTFVTVSMASTSRGYVRVDSSGTVTANTTYTGSYALDAEWP